MPQRKNHPVYRAVLKLYPKAHRQEYGEQMVQTLDDLLSERQESSERAGIWLRVILELPSNLAEEHIHTIRGLSMSDRKLTNKNILVIVGVSVVVVGVVLAFVLFRNDQYNPTTLAKVPKSATPPACLQRSNNPNLLVNAEDKTFIDNTIVSSIIDVPAGTNVDIYLKSYDGTRASGTGVYSGKYGSYNFTAKKTSSNAGDDYVGGWELEKFEVCKG